ncbi:MAG: hypothetical protein KGJ43_05855, partial [Acidobacteriota bacterium]|nr:hypothetical protein [Acidobacteriota bacterium]
GLGLAAGGAALLPVAAHHSRRASLRAPDQAHDASAPDPHETAPAGASASASAAAMPGAAPQTPGATPGGQAHGSAAFAGRASSSGAPALVETAGGEFGIESARSAGASVQASGATTHTPPTATVSGTTADALRPAPPTTRAGTSAAATARSAPGGGGLRQGHSPADPPAQGPTRQPSDHREADFTFE